MESGQEKVPKSEATREKILATALALFAEKGFASTTMREIASRSGCSLGLAYRYFPTKDAMVLTLYERLVEEFAEESGTLPSSRLAERWGAATRGDFARLRAHRGALAGLTSAGLTVGSETQVLGPGAAAVRHRMVGIFASIVSGAKDAPARETGDALASLLYALHLLLVLFWLQDPTLNQRATGQLIDFGEEMLGRLRLILRLPWAASSLLRLNGILAPILGASIDRDG